MIRTVFVGIFLIAGVVANAAGENTVSLSNGVIQYTEPPEEWVVSQVKGESAIYTLPGKGMLQVSAILNIAPKTRQAEEPTKQVLLAELRDMRNKSKAKDNVEIVKALEFEKDDRFFCVLNEQYRKNGNVFEQTHYYRNLGPHQFLVTVVSLAEPEDVKNMRETAAKVSLSAALAPKGEKAPAPKLGAEVAAANSAEASAAEKASAANRAELEAAQKELDAAIAKCDAKLARDPKYKTAKAAADAAEAKLIQLRSQQPPDRAAIAQASEDWLEAKRPVEAMRKEMLAKDPEVAEGRKKVAAARAKK